MAGPNISKLYDQIFKLKDKIDEAKILANEIITDSQPFGGEIARVISSQFSKYTVPALEKISSDPNTPGGLIPIINFLDSVPLGLARTQKIEPKVETENQPPPSKTSIEAAPSQQAQEAIKRGKIYRGENGRQYFVRRK